MQIKVVKFGGSSLADAEHFKRVAEIIKADPSRRYVVASAPGKRFPGDTKVTDMLYTCYEMMRNHENVDKYYEQIKDRYYGILNDLGLNFDISGELEYVKNAMLHRAGRDYAASRGEYINSLILAKYLGFDFVDAENVIVFRDDGSLDEEATYETMRIELARHEYAVIPGFYGCMPNGTIKTFTRGGSDFTGSIVANAVGASLYENWTDVSGFMMADPRVVKDPVCIDTITYRELRALSYMGATVLHEEAIFPVRNAGIPINIRNTNAPNDKGTMIVANTNEYDQDCIITAISGKKGFSVITIEKAKMNSDISFVRRLLEVLEDNEISFEHAPAGIDSISLILSTSQIEGKSEKIIASMNRRVHPDSITIENGISLIAIVGRGMVKNKGVSARVLSSIADAGVNIRMIDQGSSEFNIIVGVEEHDFEKTVNSIYREFVKKKSR